MLKSAYIISKLKRFARRQSNKLAFLVRHLFIKDKIYYVGYNGRLNFGDDLLLDIFRRVADTNVIFITDVWFYPNLKNERVVLGGGTIIGGEMYARAIEETESDLCFSFWGGVIFTEYNPRWNSILRNLDVRSRSIQSSDYLISQGLVSSPGVDPAIYTSLIYGVNVERKRSLLLAPHGGYDNFDFYVSAINYFKLVSPEISVSIFSCSPEDDSVSEKLATLFRVAVICGYKSIQASVSSIASADYVISTRLHPLVVAASYEVNFLCISYSEKHLEFLATIDMADKLVGTSNFTDELYSLISSSFNWVEVQKKLGDVGVFYDKVKAIND